MATGGVFWPPARISRLVSLLPYNSSLASLSGRKVAPCKAIPAKSPLARDQESISAVIWTSVQGAPAKVPLGAPPGKYSRRHLGVGGSRSLRAQGPRRNGAFRAQRDF